MIQIDTAETEMSAFLFYAHILHIENLAPTLTTIAEGSLSNNMQLPLEPQNPKIGGACELHTIWSCSNYLDFIQCKHWTFNQ